MNDFSRRRKLAFWLFNLKYLFYSRKDAKAPRKHTEDIFAELAALRENQSMIFDKSISVKM
jgi:hypothetical protein